MLGKAEKGTSQGQMLSYLLWKLAKNVELSPTKTISGRFVKNIKFMLQLALRRASERAFDRGLALTPTERRCFSSVENVILHLLFPETSEGAAGTLECGMYSGT